MKKTIPSAGMLLLLFLLAFSDLQSQSFIRKIKDKAEDAAVDKIFQDKNQSGSETGSNVYSGNDNNSPSNTRGGGLNTTAPDVMENIASAEASFDKKEYKDARYAVRQAILGVELEIGKNILKSLPGSIDGLPAVETEDEVASAGIGFVGLVIHRVYREGDREYGVMIGNDAAMLSAANMYMASGAYGSSSQDENMKQTKFKDHQAVIQYDESSGYQLSVPFGQSSILLLNGINFESEDKFMAASEEVDIESIKKQLGEQ